MGMLQHHGPGSGGLPMHLMCPSALTPCHMRRRGGGSCCSWLYPGRQLSRAAADSWGCTCCRTASATAAHGRSGLASASRTPHAACLARTCCSHGRAPKPPLRGLPANRSAAMPLKRCPWKAGALLPSTRPSAAASRRPPAPPLTARVLLDRGLQVSPPSGYGNASAHTSATHTHTHALIHLPTLPPGTQSRYRLKRGSKASCYVRECDTLLTR